MNAGGQEMLDAAWREAPKITYRDHVIDYGNDGHPENDSVLPAADRQRQQAAIAVIVEQTGISPGFIRSELLDAAAAYGQAPAHLDSEYLLGPPDWEDLATRWRKHQVRATMGPEETVLSRRLSHAPPQVQRQFIAAQGPQGCRTITESALAAAYQAVAERSGITLLTDPARDGNPTLALAPGQGVIFVDGSMHLSPASSQRCAAPARCSSPQSVRQGQHRAWHRVTPEEAVSGHHRTKDRHRVRSLYPLTRGGPDERSRAGDGEA